MVSTSVSRSEGPKESPSAERCDEEKNFRGMRHYEKHSGKSLWHNIFGKGSLTTGKNFVINIKGSDEASGVLATLQS
ncbi:hypothetical protein EJB05_30236, partial [Eragrostis curvula]